MTILLPTPVLGPFGGNQLIVALNTAHAEARTTCGRHRRHGSHPPCFDFFWVARRSENSTTADYLAIHFNFIDRNRNFS
jgi:hypothetical protein